MKKFYSLLILATTVSMANAAIKTITVQASSFSPATVSAVCNDTIIWIWGQAGTHTTTSTTIPGCATAWNNPISAASLTFAITVPCAGTYNYKCTPHGFTGTIVVTCTSAVPSINNDYFSGAYPNPFISKITIETPDADMISLYNMAGEKIKTISLQRGHTKTEINLPDLNSGIYFYCLLKEGVVIETRKIVKI